MQLRGNGAWTDAHQVVGRVPLIVTSPHDAAAEVCRLAVAERTGGRHVHLVNAYTIACADKDPRYRKVLVEGALNLPDGKPLEWVTRALRLDPPLRQVRGPGLLVDVLDVGQAYGVRHFLLGSTPEVLDLMVQEAHARFPGAQIVGCDSPPFSPADDAEFRRRDRLISESGADLVWVGLGTPKQDYEAERIARNLPVTAVAVGAAFDILAGTLPEAPRWASRLGLEWLFRLAREPRRLWRRYLFGNARFLRVALWGAARRAIG
jgi:N-acetylglucosaminyldiphosphoundecaprenol N-acetyl-beta-D-mannosaminyltransferase